MTENYKIDNHEEIDEELLYKKLNKKEYKDTFIEYNLCNLPIKAFQIQPNVRMTQFYVNGKLKSDPNNYVDTSVILRGNLKEGWIYTKSKSLYRLEEEPIITQKK